MNEVQSEGFRQELVRIRFRQALLSLPGGPAWLVHIGRLFGFHERFFAPGNFGLPNVLRIGMYRLGW
jgi:hypothetical protein